MPRHILHVDCNKFYASVECCMNPALRDKPVVVGGNEDARHGIVLTKNEIAASYGIATGESDTPRLMNLSLSPSSDETEQKNYLE